MDRATVVTFGLLGAVAIALPMCHAARAEDGIADRQPMQPEVLGHVRFHQKISFTSGGFLGMLEDDDRFGGSLASLGDLDGNGVADLAVGATGIDGGRGAVWILFLHPNGTVLTTQKISDTDGGFTGGLEPGDLFGSSVASLGDLDGDGVTDIAVGAQSDGVGVQSTGAVWILFLHPNGTVRSHQKIREGEGGFTGALEESDLFGGSVASLGDLDGDGVTDLAVGAQQDDDGSGNAGAVWILFMNPSGIVRQHQKISATEGGFAGDLDGSDYFGLATTSVGDLDGDGVIEIAVGASGDDDGDDYQGAVWLLHLNPDGTVRDHRKISATEGGFTGSLDPEDRFGSSVGSLGDLDCDGVTELAVGARTDDDGGDDAGAVWNLFLRAPGTVRMHTKISATSGGFSGALDLEDHFGQDVEAVGDLDGDGNVDLAVGASRDDDGGLNRGAVWILFLDGNECFGQDTGHVFEDGLESGDTSAWSGFVN